MNLKWNVYVSNHQLGKALAGNGQQANGIV